MAIDPVRGRSHDVCLLYKNPPFPKKISPIL
jgi:hypothetical protein